MRVPTMLIEMLGLYRAQGRRELGLYKVSIYEAELSD